MGRGFVRPAQGNPGYAPTRQDLGPGTLPANPRYAVPVDASVPEWSPNQPYGTGLRTGVDGTTPDARRLQLQDSPPESPDPRRPASENAEYVTRHRELETLHATGWQEDQQYPGTSFLNNPRFRRYDSPRVLTRAMGPNTYAFTRRWSIPQSTGVHFSMADHRRTYPVGGMKPTGRIGLNTFRLDPAPWDADRYVTGQEFTPEQRHELSATAPTSRSYRL
jgi:hypothetical protein